MLPGMVVKICGGVVAAQMMLVSDELPSSIGRNPGRYAVDERGGRTLQTCFNYFQRTCHHGASGTSDTGKEKRVEHRLMIDFGFEKG